jgi:NAD(P)H dehydrogenase (quinone)
MRIQVVHGHPLTDSYNAALFQRITQTLRDGGHEVIGTDLYREGFQPALTESERRSYVQPPYDDSGVALYTELLRRIDGVIFCFPHWWFSMPAMMKGYFDRVWGPGIAFDHDREGGRILPLLRNIRLFGVVTSYGAPWWIVRLYAGDPGRKVLMRGLRPLCHAKTDTFYLAHYDMDRSTPETRAAFFDKVTARLVNIR